jgi:hypothetical protein
VARCNRFSIEARERFSVQAAEISLHAQAGSVVIEANDDVALRGEQILLNCDRDDEIPGWVPQGPELTLPPSAQQGDVELLLDAVKKIES